ncbi:endonuclease III domain-containing protein [Candidatus Latescibacterota bacterium]
MNVDIAAVVETLKKTAPEWREPIVTEIARTKHDSYLVLISTIISLRTKDEVTREASSRLYKRADTPKKMVKLNPGVIAELIYPAGFYRNKADTILTVSRDIISRFGGRVPDTIEDLLTLKGVGRKTANLVITKGYGLPGICVDTHVHRISNRLGYVSTKTPEETEFTLRGKLPQEYWIEYNDLLVPFGQNICKPISPLCSQCPVHDHCKRVRVTIHR